MFNENVNQRNENGDQHGYWEEYWDDGNLWRKANFKDGFYFGLVKIYHSNGIIQRVGSYDVDCQPIGLFEFYDSDGELMEQIFYA